MHSSFQLLDSAKQDRIINAVLAEFAKHGFAKASTNSIVAQAGISKGLLFHYFSNKETLYRDIAIWAYQTLIAEVEHGIDWSQRDFFTRIGQVWRIKAKVMLQYPYLAKFVASVTQDASVEAAKEMVGRYRPGLLKDVYTKNIDFAKFRSDVQLVQVITVVEGTMERVSQNYISKLGDTDAELLAEISGEINSYLALLQRVFYRDDSAGDPAEAQ